MDFNFFEPYMRVSAKPDSKRFLLITLAIVLVAVLVYYQFYLTSRIHAAEDTLAEIDAYMTSQEVQNGLARVESKRAKADELELTLQTLNQTAGEIEKSNLIDEMVLEKVNAQVPEGLFLSELTMNGDLLSLKGYAQRYDLVAQFAYNLRTAGGFESILIPSVEADGERYVYTMNVGMVKEGADEN